MATPTVNAMKCYLCDGSSHDADPDNREDDFVLCVYPKCKVQCEIYHRDCIKQAHKRSKHKYSDTAEYIKLAREWNQLNKRYKMEVIQSMIPSTKSKIAEGTKCGIGATAAALYGIASTGQQVMNTVAADTTLKEGFKQFSKLATVSKSIRRLRVRDLYRVLRKLGKTAKESRQIIAKISAEGGEEAIELALKNYGKAVGKQGGKMALTTVKQMAKGQVIVSVAFWILEIGWNAKKFYYDKSITKEEYERLNNKALAANTCSCIGGVIGGTLGLVGGPVGVAIGSALGGIAADYFARDHFDKKYPNKEQQQIKDALITFNLLDKTVDASLKSDDFNVKELEKRYRHNSWYHSPDTAPKEKTQKQKDERWHKFYNEYCLLLALCRQKNERKNNQIDI